MPGVGAAGVGASGRGTATVFNGTATIVYLGGATVTASGAKQGIPLNPNSSFSVDIAFDDVLYGIVVTGTAAINVIVAMVA